MVEFPRLDSYTDNGEDLDKLFACRCDDWCTDDMKSDRATLIDYNFKVGDDREKLLITMSMVNWDEISEASENVCNIFKNSGEYSVIAFKNVEDAQTSVDTHNNYYPPIKQWEPDLWKGEHLWHGLCSFLTFPAIRKFRQVVFYYGGHGGNMTFWTKWCSIARQDLASVILYRNTLIERLICIDCCCFGSVTAQEEPRNENDYSRTADGTTYSVSDRVKDRSSRRYNDKVVRLCAAVPGFTTTPVFTDYFVEMHEKYPVYFDARVTDFSRFSQEFRNFAISKLQNYSDVDFYNDNYYNFPFCQGDANVLRHTNFFNGGKHREDVHFCLSQKNTGGHLQSYYAMDYKNRSDAFEKLKGKRYVNGTKRERGYESLHFDEIDDIYYDYSSFAKAGKNNGYVTSHRAKKVKDGQLYTLDDRFVDFDKETDTSVSNNLLSTTSTANGISVVPYNYEILGGEGEQTTWNDYAYSDKIARTRFSNIKLNLSESKKRIYFYGEIDHAKLGITRIGNKGEFVINETFMEFNSDTLECTSHKLLQKNKYGTIVQWIELSSNQYLTLF